MVGMTCELERGSFDALAEDLNGVSGEYGVRWPVGVGQRA